MKKSPCLSGWIMYLFSFLKAVLGSMDKRCLSMPALWLTNGTNSRFPDEITGRYDVPFTSTSNVQPRSFAERRQATMREVKISKYSTMSEIVLSMSSFRVIIFL